MCYTIPRIDACVAQLAEQLTRNEQVAGSNPATSSKSDRILLNTVTFISFRRIFDKCKAEWNCFEGCSRLKESIHRALGKLPSTVDAFLFLIPVFLPQAFVAAAGLPDVLAFGDEQL